MIGRHHPSVRTYIRISAARGRRPPPTGQSRAAPVILTTGPKLCGWPAVRSRAVLPVLAQLGLHRQGQSPYGALARPVERREHRGRDQPDQYPARTDRWRGVPTSRRVRRGALDKAITGPHGGPRRISTRSRTEGGSQHSPCKVTHRRRSEARHRNSAKAPQPSLSRSRNATAGTTETARAARDGHFSQIINIILIILC